MNAAEIEKRTFSKEELDKINGYTEEVNGIDATIKTQRQARALITTIKEPATQTKQEQTSLLNEIRALQADANKEIEVGTREIRDGTHTFSDSAVRSGNVPTEIISKITFADYILDKLAEFYDNRTITVNDRLNLRVNMILESLLGRHSVNLL